MIKNLFNFFRYGLPISSGLQPLAMPLNMPWGLTQTIGTNFGSRYSILGG